MRFRSYDRLRLVDAVARHVSFTAVAAELNRSKGSVGYQIGKLEADLGFMVFHRHHPRISLTLDDYGYYLVYPAGVPDKPIVASFRQWIIEEARV